MGFVYFSQYSKIVLALRRGDIRLLRHALQEHEDRYVSSNAVFMIIHWHMWMLSKSVFCTSDQILKIRGISCP